MPEKFERLMKPCHMCLPLTDVLIIVFLFQTRTISVVSEQTKKQLDQMIAQNKELEEILAKSRSDYNAKVRHKPSLFRLKFQYGAKMFCFVLSP